MDANDGRKVTGYLPDLIFESTTNPVVQVIHEASGEILYTVRVQGDRFQPRVYGDGKYTVKVGTDKPNVKTITSMEASSKQDGLPQIIKF